MSRIDEALKRVSQGPYGGRGLTRRNDGALLLAEDRILDEYPREGRVSAQKEGVIPEDTPTAREAHGWNASAQPAQQRSRAFVNQESDGKLVVGAPVDVVSIEQYRRLAATLHDAQVENGLKMVMVTSAVPREGKTLTVVNLALTLSESYGRRVLLVDADLRRPGMHEVLRVPNGRGLGDVLVSSCVELPLTQLSEKLWVLPAGRVEANPLAGLSSDRMRRLLDEVAGRFDWVLLDAPPVGLLPDAHVLGRLVRASLFVIRAGMTPLEAVDRAIADLGRDCIFGIVLNGVDPSTLPTAGYYGHYYAKH